MEVSGQHHGSAAVPPASDIQGASELVWEIWTTVYSRQCSRTLSLLEEGDMIAKTAEGM